MDRDKFEYLITYYGEYVVIVSIIGILVSYCALESSFFAVIFTLLIPAVILLKLYYFTSSKVERIQHNINLKKVLTDSEKEMLASRIFTLNASYYYITHSKIEVVTDKPLIMMNFKRGNDYTNTTFDHNEPAKTIDVKSVINRDLNTGDIKILAEKLNSMHGFNGETISHTFIASDGEAIYYGDYLYLRAENHSNFGYKNTYSVSTYSNKKWKKEI